MEKKSTCTAQLLCVVSFLPLAQVSRAELPLSLSTGYAPAVRPFFLVLDVAAEPATDLERIYPLSFASTVTTLSGVRIRASLPTPPGVAPTTTFLFQHRVITGGSPSVGPAELSLGGSALQSWLKGARTLYAADLDAGHLDVNLRGSRTLAAMTAERKMRGWSASISQSLNPNWRLSAELCGYYRNREETPQTSSLFSVAASYAIGKALTFDAGIARRLSAAAPDTTAFFAVSMPLDAAHR
jgi:hypothetical protein